ncbi:MAG: VTT domain-containing protein [Myxococcota bacterium]
MQETALPSAAATADAAPGGWRLVIGTVVSLLLLFLMVWGAATALRDEIQTLGRLFVEHFGVGGMFLGSFLADGVHFPIPPQFYMLTTVTSGREPVPALAAITIGSIVGGNVSYLIAGQLYRVRALHRFIDRARAKAEPMFARYGYWAVAIGSVTPFPYSTLCNAAGLCGMPYRLFAVLSLFRVPRILMFYLLIRLGWS